MPTIDINVIFKSKLWIFISRLQRKLVYHRKKNSAMRFITTLPILSLYCLKSNINLEGEVLKVKIDSFDTKREQSPISHFHGNNLYTTSREHNIFLSSNTSNIACAIKRNYIKNSNEAQRKSHIMYATDDCLNLTYNFLIDHNTILRILKMDWLF